MPHVDDPNLLVGSGTSDDSAVYRLNDDIALVQSLDFFPPIVDDPYSFGAIAAANSLSDIYAMGAKPLFALNLVAWPREPAMLELLCDDCDTELDFATLDADQRREMLLLLGAG